MIEDGLLRLMMLLPDEIFTHVSRSIDEIGEKKEYEMPAQEIGSTSMPTGV
jgi:hypothetical protein